MQTWGESDKRMTGSSKILTVSYGTFSCTLEGFDDPFSTMRTIAEYFRDLAAEDRYFGAEPPTPDPEMLQGLAQRNAGSRIEAHVADGGIALKQVEATTEIAEAPAEIETPAEPFEADEPEDAFDDLSEVTAPKADLTDSIAEKLSRIRAVASRSIDPTGTPDEETDNIATDPISFDGEDLVVETGAKAPITSDEGPSEQDLANARLSETIASLTAAAEIDDPETEDEDGTEDEDVGPAIDAHFDAVEIEYELEDEAEEDVAPTVEGSEDFDDEDREEYSTEFDAVEEHVDEFENDEDDSEEEDAPIYDGPEAVLTLVETEPEPEPEELVAIEEDDLVENVPSEEVEGEPEKVARIDTAEEPDVSRLMAEADQQFDDDDSRRRRRVISQLRAAVVAAKADGDGGLISTETDSSEQIAYREDLSRVVSKRPRANAPMSRVLPQPVDDTEEAPTPIATPLMLGSEQRVQPEPLNDPTVEAEPVSVEDVSSFAEFAERMGAKELPDLLEAAAAYTAFVEGQGSFSRPQIMKRVARIQPAIELSREAGLRSFGQLLRQGKIQKLQRGEFTIAETTRFNPGVRIAGE